MFALRLQTDCSPPTCSNASIASDNAVQPSMATVGDIVTLTLATSKALLSVPNVTVVGGGSS